MMADPLMLAIATAVAGKAGEAAADGVRASLRALRTLIRGRLARDGADSTVLAAASGAPLEPRHVEALASALETAGRSDEAFRNRLLAQWRDLDARLTAADTSVVNSISGSVVTGGVIQAGNIVVHGDASLGHSPVD